MEVSKTPPPSHLMPQAADLRGVLNEKRAASMADKGAPAPTSDVPTAAVKCGHRRSPHKSVNFAYGSKRSAAAVGLAAPGAHGVDTLSQVDAGIVTHDSSSDGIVRLFTITMVAALLNTEHPPTTLTIGDRRGRVRD